MNRIDGQATIAPTDAFNKHFIAVVWGDDSGTVLRKELVILTVEVQQEFVVNTHYNVAKPIPAEKLRSGFTFMSGVTGWEASFSDGKLELFPDNGIPTSGAPIELGRIRWDDMAPDGYHFKSYVRLNSGNGEETYSGIGVWTWPNANGRGVDELYEVTWYNDTDNTSLLQNLAVYQYDKMPYYRYISKDSVTAAPVASLGLDTAQLSSSGIGVTYDETTGCFHVSHSGWELPDASTLLDTRITPTPPEGAVYFSANHDDGNRDPRIMGKSEASDILASLESFEKYSVTDSNRVNERSLELVRTQVVHLPGIDVCLSGSSNHRGLTVAWWDADKNLIGMSYVYGQNDDFMNRTRLTSVETADKLDDLNTRGEVNAPALVGAEGMELVCDRYPQTGNGMTQFFDLHLLNDQGGTKTVYIPYHCFGMTYADDVQGKSADELPAIIVKHFDANYNFRNEIIGRYEPQGIVFETDSFSPFTVSVGNEQSGGDADGYGDNIGDYDRWGEGSAWNGDPLQYMVIKSLRNIDGRDRLELGVDWRYDKVGSIYNVGITPEVLTQIVNANKPLVIYNERELTLSPATLSDMLQKLNVLNANRGAEDNEALLWFRYEYGNRDGENGQAYAFMITVYLGDTRYRLPDGETYTFSIFFDRSDATSYELYCPADPEDASSELVKQANPLSCVDGHNDDGHSWRQCSFTADHDGMFVIHPKGYQMQQSWPWWGVPTPPWTPSPDATTPNSEVPELRSLYASGFKFPVIGKDIHFIFPEQLKEWTEGCGDDWDYRFTVDESKGRVAIEVNMGSRERWEDAVRNIETGGLDDGVFFRYYFGNSDNQLPMTYGYDWYGDYGGQSLADNTLYRGYHHNNGLHLATVNRQNAHNSVLTLNSQGENWRIILAMSNSEGKVADAEAKYAFQLEILPREDISFSLPADNGTAVPAARLHPTDIHSDWMATVPADGSVFLRTVEDKTLNDAGSGQYGLLGELTVDAPEGYTLREWRNNCTGGSGGQFPVPLFRDDQVITLIWQKVNAPDLVEYVRVEPMNYLPGFYSLGDKNAPSRAPSAAEFLSTAEQKTLSDNGITVTYDEKLGYFTTSVDASKLTDLSLLYQCVTPKAPENAAYFRFTGEGGSENPATHNKDESIQKAAEHFKNPATRIYPVAENGPIQMHLMLTKALPLDGKTVYYSESQMYHSLIVQWLDEGKNVIGYTCLYGRNGDISTTVDTDTVDTAPTEAVSVPTLVGTDLKLLCDRNPQTEDGKRLFLLFNVTGEGQLGEDGAEIYLPYSYFDLTAEAGLALAAKGVRPLIRHYLNENCTEKESLLGEYTAAGVRIVTRSFSPFLIDANGCTVGDLNGDGAVDTLDMQALYENLSTGRTTEKLADKDDFRPLADYNGDGAVNILDYQKLYQDIKTA
ncbi:dockerin type I repeat-containing protein [Vescimonas sp.]|uniref:dockerin type I repeat-containing protein n=1 Tax=Vescimonas sp. TaxID=2892404 RepID=UPI003F7DEE9A